MLSTREWLQRFICLMAGVMSVCISMAQTVDFTATPTSGCSPLPVMFTNTSTGFSDNATYLWDFWNGNTYGCYSTLKQPDLIQVLPSVNPAFTASQTVLCKVNDPVTFINNSTGEGTLSYNWDFGDGTTSTSENPQHQYNIKGTYNVKLEVTNSDGCKVDTLIPAYINVANYHAD